MTTETVTATDFRQQRALMIAATARIVGDGLRFHVPSQSTNAQYMVTRELNETPCCTCPDFELRQKPCKHIMAVEIVLRRETMPDGTVIETRAARITYGQDWPAYNRAQTTEKEHFGRFLHDLCATAPEPAQTRGRPRLPLADRLFAAAFKVYSTQSGRRCQTDLRDACGRGLLSRPVSYNSVFKVIEDAAVTPILHNLITASALPLKEVELDYAVDSTGFGTSQFFRYYSEKYGRAVSEHDWLKCHAMVGVKTNIVTAVRITDRTGKDHPEFVPLVQATANAGFGIRDVSADKAYSSRLNLTFVASKGATAYIPFKTHTGPEAKGSPIWRRAWHYFSLNREDFLAHYHNRSNVESTFSAIKRVFGDSVRSRTRVAQINEVLLKILCHNIRCLVHEMHELGIMPAFRSLLCPQNEGGVSKVGH